MSVSIVPVDEFISDEVTAVGLATMVISDGDEVEVDGTTGEVTVLRRAGGRP